MLDKSDLGRSFITSSIIIGALIGGILGLIVTIFRITGLLVISGVHFFTGGGPFSALIIAIVIGIIAGACVGLFINMYTGDNGSSENEPPNWSSNPFKNNRRSRKH